jgi:hypothetical protein
MFIPVFGKDLLIRGIPFEKVKLTGGTDKTLSIKISYIQFAKKIGHAFLWRNRS